MKNEVKLLEEIIFAALNFVRMEHVRLRAPSFHIHTIYVLFEFPAFLMIP
jgi:hypothetical protein